MTVSSTTTKNSYSGNGSTTVFAYGFKVFDEDDLTVILRADATGTETVQSITTNYTVSGVGNAGGGNVTFVTAPATGVTVVIRRASPLTQTTDYTPNDPFPAASHEDALDNLTFIAQQQQEELDRAIKLSRTNTMTSTEFTVGDTARANKILGFDGSGELSVTQELGVFRGDWSVSTTFAVRDLIKDTTNNNIYICQTAHTSSGSLPLSTNADIGKWELIVDAASATTSASAAAASATAAASSATDAETAETAAEAAQVAAETAETNAETAETNAETAQTAAETAQTAAETAQTAAETAETNAETSETNAAASETAAASSASSASTSAATATTQAGIATTKAGEASTSATNAATSETNAATSETNASTSASNAATSESNAATSESNASTSASNAATSATNAATSESNAASSATASASSATASAASASAASTSESNASTSESNAASSASSASTSAATATTQAGIATTKAGEASTSASNAASSATSASSAQTAAESARDATLAAYDNFDDRYLGTKSTAPTVDNDGNALVAGALYFDSVAEAMYVYTGSAWVAAYVSGTGFLALTGGTMSGDITFGDNDKAIFGAGSDLQIYHDGSNSYIAEGGDQTGDLFVRASNLKLTNASGDLFLWGRNADSVRLYHNNAQKLETTSTGVDVTGNATFADNGKAIFGAGSDLQVYHDGSNSYIDDTGAGDMLIRGSARILLRKAGTTENMIRAEADSYVKLYYDNAEKLATTATGVDVTGTVTATAFSGDGSALTGIAAGATGGGDDQIFYENGQTVTTNYTITDGKNAMSAGPITINSGVTVTVGTGETWTVV